MTKVMNLVKQAGGLAIAEILNPEPSDILIPRLDPKKVAAFEAFRPSFYDERFGCVRAELHAIVVDDGSLETVAYYDALVPDGDDRVRMTTYRYEVVDRVITAVKQYPMQVLHRSEVAHRHRPRWRLMR